MQASGHNIDFDHWHREVHGSLPYDECLASDIALRELLCSVELPRFVFTNADEKHASICLDRLGIADCFQVMCPPSPEHAHLAVFLHYISYSNATTRCLWR